MSLDPLLQAAVEIRLHAFAAIAALLLGFVQFVGGKGTAAHRARGWVWVALMALVAVSSLFVNTTCTFGPFSAIHLLTLVTIVVLPMAVLAARRHLIARHARLMTLLYVAALVVAGAFTFLPGRIMHDVAFGTTSKHPRCWPTRGMPPSVRG
ncbi:MAG TPA: DUF2306 domain-containing protein [Rhodoblastus sp.]|nr:DUF2306 domain-containing protein [Rhodoblastus sp.]